MPRRWCKTMNATMLCFFLQEEVDSEGKRLKDQFASPERSFLAPNGKYSNFKIMKKEGFLENHFANYTVIYASFGNSFGNDFKQMKANFALIVQEVFFEHYYLKNVMQKSLERKEDTFLEYFMTKFENVIENRAEETDLIHCFRFLSKLLNLHFKRKVIIIVDEFDTCINKMLTNKTLKYNEANLMEQFYEAFLLSSFKHNPYVQKCFLTGISQAAIKSIASGLNNFMLYSFASNPFGNFFSFSLDEVNALFLCYGVPLDVQLQAKYMYNGYHLLVDKKERLQAYNPYSIVAMLQDAESRVDKSLSVRSYWSGTANITFLKNLFKREEIAAVIRDLLACSAEEYIILRDASLNDKYLLDDDFKSLFFSLLFTCGYLDIWQEHDLSIFSVRIPNEEIRMEFEQSLKSYYKCIFKKYDKEVDKVSFAIHKLFETDGEHLVPGAMINTEPLRLALQNLVLATPEFIDITSDEDEAGIHGNERVFHSVFDHSVMRLESVRSFGIEANISNTQLPDSAFRTSQSSTAIIAKHKFVKTRTQPKQEQLTRRVH